MRKELLWILVPVFLLLVLIDEPTGIISPEPSSPLTDQQTTPRSSGNVEPWCDPDGITILLMGEDPAGRFESNLQDATSLGASWVQIMFPSFQANHDSSSFPIADHRSPSRIAVEKACEMTRASGFKVALHPILLIQDPLDEHWRGQLDPVSRADWFDHYQRWIVSWSQLASECGVHLFFVGSELSSMQTDHERWNRILDSVRAEFRGPITYSGNWDCWRDISFAGRLDALGVNAYLPLTKDKDYRPEQLIQSLLPLRSQLHEWSMGSGVPVFFSEVGYPSHDRALEAPWDQYRGDQVDLEAQKIGYETFIATFSRDEHVRGVFFYALHEEGGLDDHGYTPAGKPAMDTLRQYFRDRSDRHKELRTRP